MARDGDRMRRRGATGKVLRGAGNSRRRGERIPASRPRSPPRGERGGHLIFRVVSSFEGTVTARLLCAAGRGGPRATDRKMTRAPPAGSLLHRGGGARVAAGRSVSGPRRPPPSLDGPSGCARRADLGWRAVACRQRHRAGRSTARPGRYGGPTPSSPSRAARRGRSSGAPGAGAVGNTRVIFSGKKRLLKSRMLARTPRRAPQDDHEEVAERGAAGATMPALRHRRHLVEIEVVGHDEEDCSPGVRSWADSGTGCRGARGARDRRA